MRIKYDHGKIKKLLHDEYQKLYSTSGNPSSTFDKVIECLDDAFLEQYQREIRKVDQQIQQGIADAVKSAEETLTELNDKIETYKSIGAIQDRRVADALAAYKEIVSMEFETPQQKLQNIQNASYVLWALYADGTMASTAFMKEYGTNKASDVAQESDEPTWTRHVRIK